MTDLQKEIGRMLLVFGMAFVGAISGFLVQYGSNETRLSGVEGHLTTDHPNKDYRKLLDERYQSMLSADREIRRRLTILENR